MHLITAVPRKRNTIQQRLYWHLSVMTSISHLTRRNQSSLFYEIYLPHLTWSINKFWSTTGSTLACPVLPSLGSNLIAPPGTSVSLLPVPHPDICPCYVLFRRAILGPIAFTIYTLPLGDIACKYNHSFHIYTDDTQLYLPSDSQDPSSETLARHSIEDCINEFRS